MTLSGPVSYDIGGLKYVVPDDCKVIILNSGDGGKSSPGKPLIDPQNGGDSYQVPVGKKFTLWGAINTTNDSSDDPTTISQSDADDALTNEIKIWKGLIGDSAAVKYSWYPILNATEVAAEKYIMQYTTNDGETTWGFFIGCEENA